MKCTYEHKYDVFFICFVEGIAQNAAELAFQLELAQDLPHQPCLRLFLRPGVLFGSVACSLPLLVVQYQKAAGESWQNEGSWQDQVCWMPLPWRDFAYACLCSSKPSSTQASTPMKCTGGKGYREKMLHER